MPRRSAFPGSESSLPLHTQFSNESDDFEMLLAWRETSSQASLTREPRNDVAFSRIWQTRVRCGASVAAMCKPEGAAPANATLIAQKNLGRFLRAAGFQWKSSRGGCELTYLNPLVAAKEISSAFVSSLFSFSLSAQKSRVHLMSLLQV